MSRFIQLHLLTAYPPANLNRDDLGRPKTAMMGGETRLRISSQSLKRAWRTSDVFKQALGSNTGTRTREMGETVRKILIDKGIDEKKALEWARKIAEKFGKLQGKETAAIEQLTHFSPEEKADIEALAVQLAERGSEPSDEELELLRQQHSAADIALFGRMLASAPKYNTDAAAQVAHAISVHKVVVEDDFFTAVDDLNDADENRDDAGAAHMGETEFAAGLFYQYICIDKQLLTDNLGNDSELVKKTLQALTEAAATVAPTGKQNSFASRARASFILAEKGDQQPRSLSVAFLKSVTNQGEGMLSNAIQSLKTTRENMDKVYGACADFHKIMNTEDEKDKGSLQDIINFVGA